MNKIDSARQRAQDLLIRAHAANNLSQEADNYKNSINRDLEIANTKTDLLEAADIQSSGPEGVAGSMLHSLAVAGVPFVTGANSVQTGNANWNQIANNAQIEVMNKIGRGEKLTPQEQVIANQEVGGNTDPVKQAINVVTNPLNTAHMIGQSIGGTPTVAEAARQTKNFGIIRNNADKDAETNNWEGAPAYNKIDQERLNNERLRLQSQVKPSDDSTLGMLSNFKDLLGAVYQAANNERAGATSSLLESAVYLLPGVGTAALVGDIGNMGLEASARAREDGRIALTEEEQQRIALANMAYGAAGIIGNKFAKAGLGITKKATSKEGANALTRLLSKEVKPKSALGRAGLHIGGHGLIEGVEEGFQSAMEDYAATGEIDFANVAFGAAMGSIGGASMSIPGGIVAMGKGPKKKANKKDTSNQDIELDNSQDFSHLTDDELINLDSDNFNPSEVVRRRFVNLMDDTKTFTNEDINNNINEVEAIRSKLIDEEDTLTEQVKRHSTLSKAISDLDVKIAETNANDEMRTSSPSLHSALVNQLEKAKQDAVNELNGIGDINTINSRLNKIMEYSDDLDSAIDDFKTNAELMDEYSDEITSDNQTTPSTKVNNKPSYTLQEDDWSKTDSSNITENQQRLVNAVDTHTKDKPKSVKELTDMVAKTLGVDISNPEDAKKLFNEINKASQLLKEKKVKPMKIKSLDSKATPEQNASKILASPASYTTNQIKATINQLPADNPIAIQLRSLIDERVQANSVKGKDDVANQILDGNKALKVNSADNFIGINQYNARFADAAKNNNEKTYNYHLRKLANFAKSHRGKADAVKAALESGKEGYVVKDSPNGEWSFVEQLPKGKTRAQLGAVEIKQDGTTKSLHTKIEQEAQLIENTLANRTNAKEFIFNKQDSNNNTPPPSEDDEVVTPPSTPKKEVDDSNLRTDGLLNAIYTAIKTINSKGVQQIYNSLVKTVIEGTNPNKLIAAKDNSGVHKAIANYFGNAFTNKGVYKEDDVVLFYPDNVDVMSGKASLKSHFTYTPTDDDNTASFMSKEIRDAVKAGSTITMFPESSRISFDEHKGANKTDYKSYTDYLLANDYEEIQNSKGKGTGVFIPVGSNRVIKPRVSKTDNEGTTDDTVGLNLSELENLDFKNPTETLSKVIKAVKQVQDKISSGQLKVSNLNGWMAQVLRVMGIDNNLSNENSAKFQQVIGQVRDYLKQDSNPDINKVKVILTGKSPYLAKDQSKSDKANKFIGYGVAGSSTDIYRLDWSKNANVGKYTKDDVVFISINGNRSNRIGLNEDYKNQIDKAIKAQATLITDNAQDRNRPFNIGERELANYLISKGYHEINNNGVWLYQENNEEQKLINEGWELVREAKSTNTKVFKKGSNYKYVKDNVVTDASPKQASGESLFEQGYELSGTDDNGNAVFTKGKETYLVDAKGTITKQVNQGENTAFDGLTTEQQKAVESVKELPGVVFNIEQETAFSVNNSPEGITVSINPDLVSDVPLEQLLTLHSEPLLAQTTFAILESLGFNTEQIEANRAKILPNMVENILLSREIKDSKQPYNSPTNTQYIVQRAITTLEDLKIKPEKEFKVENFNLGKSVLKEDYTPPVNNTPMGRLIPGTDKMDKSKVAINNPVLEGDWVRGHVLPKLAPVTKAVKGMLLALKNSDFLKQRDTVFNSVSDYFDRLIATKDLSILDNLSTEDKARVLPQLDAFIRFHNQYAPIIRNMVNNNKNYINDIMSSRISGHLLHNGTVEEAVVTAVAIGLFEAVKQNGHQVNMTAKDIKKYLHFKKDDRLPARLKNLYVDAGIHQDALADSIGMNVINMLGITLNDQGNQSLVNELAQALGLMAIKAGTHYDGKVDPLLHQTTFNMQDHLRNIINHMPISFSVNYLKSSGLTINADKNVTKQLLVEAVLAQVPAKATFSSYRNNIQNKIEDKKLVKYYSYPVLDILMSTQGDSVISKIWGLRDNRGEPLEEPVKEIYQDKIHNSTAEVPQAMKDKLVAANQRAHTVVQKKADFVIKLFNKNKVFLLDILGQPRKMDLEKMHPTVRQDKEANAAIYARDVQDKIKWLENRRKVEGQYVNFFMNPTVWVNQRIGYLNTLFDPQTSIFARMLTSLDKASTEIHPVNDALLEQNEQGRMIATQHGLFLRAIAEGMEGATKAIFEHNINAKYGTNYNNDLLTVDKIASEHFMEMFQDYILNDETVGKAIDIINRINNDEEVSGEDIQIVSDLINKWDMAELSLGSLLDIVEYRKAYESNQSFTTEVLVSSDGVTNGPILTQLMMGIITPEKMLAGGLFTKEQGDVDYFQQKERGENDLYQEGGKQMLDHKDKIINEGPVPSTYMSDIINTLKVVDNTFGLRKAAKVILTPFNYGAGVTRLKVAVTDSFVEKLEKMYYDLYQHYGTTAYKEKTQKFNDTITDLANLHELVFSTNYSNNEMAKNTQLAFDVLIVNAEFGSDISVFKEDNTVKSTEELSKELNAYLESVGKKAITLDNLKRILKGIKYSKNKPDVAKFIADYTNNPDIEMDTNVLYSLAELVNYTTANIGATAIAKAEVKQINKRAMLNNLSNTAYNVYAQIRKSIVRQFAESENLLTKAQVAEVDKTMDKFVPLLLSANAVVDGVNQDRDASIKTGLPLSNSKKVDSDMTIKESFDFNGNSTSVSSIFKYKTLTEPGVRGLALAIQAIDSFVSSTTLAVVNGLNTHDSNSFTLSEAREGIKQQNKNVLEAALKYDLGIEFFNAFIRSLDAITGLGNQLSDDDKTIIRAILASNNLLESQEVIEAYTEQVNDSINKLKSMLTLGFIHQYSGEGGAYQLTEDDVSRINARIADLESTKNSLIKNLRNKLDKVTDTLNVEEQSTTEEAVSNSTPKGPLNITDWMNYIYSNKEDANEKAVMNKGIGKKVIDIFMAFKDKEALRKVTINQDTSLPVNSIEFDRATNTIRHNLNQDELSTAIKEGNLNSSVLQAVLKELTIAVLHNNFLFLKNGSIKFKGLKTNYDNIHRLSLNASKIINKSNLSQEDKQWLLDYFDKNQGNVEAIIYDMYVTEDNKLNELLDKVMLPATNESMLDKIVSFISKMIDIIGLDTVSLKTIIRSDATKLLNNTAQLRTSHTIVSLIKTSKEGSYEFLSPEFIGEEFDNLNFTFNSLISNLYNRQGSKNKDGIPISLTAKGVLNELKRLMANSKDIAMQPIYNEVVGFLEAHGADADVFIVDNVSGLSEGLQYHLREGNAVYDTKSGKVYIPAPSLTTKSNIRTSSVLHELLHSVTHSMIKANGKGSKLESIYNQFNENANRKVGSIRYAAENMDEFVSQVMTLQEVRDELTSLGISMEEFNTALAEVMDTDTSTVETVSGIAALNDVIQDNDNNPDNNFVVLKVTNNSTVDELRNFVSQFSSNTGIVTSRIKKDIIAHALFNMSYNEMKEVGITLADVKNRIPKGFESLNVIIDKQFTDLDKGDSTLLASPASYNSEQVFSPTEIFNFLGTQSTNNNSHLNIVMATVVEPLMNLLPNDLVKGYSVGSVWRDALTRGTPVFVSEAYNSGFKLDDQQAYVMETVQVAIDKAFDSLADTPAYRVLKKSYASAKKQITVSDFHKGDWSIATEDEKQLALDKWNFVFNTPLASNPKSEYLSRFAALAVANDEFRDILNTVFDAKEESVNSISQKAMNTVVSVIDWIYDNDVKANKNDDIANKVSDLMEQLADIYQKNLDEANETNATILDSINDKVEGVSKFVEKKLTKTIKSILKSDFMKNNVLGRISDKLVRLEVTEIAEFINHAHHEMYPGEPQGTIKSLIDEISGFDSKEMFFKAKQLFHSSKSIEQLREQVAEATANAVVKFFAKDNQSFSKEEMKAMSQLLRIDAQVLLDNGYEYEDIIYLMENPDKLTAEINKLERNIIAQSKTMSNEYIIRAKDLGQYLITRKASNTMLAKNATAIYRSAGLPHYHENDNRQTIKEIDKLVTLYALRALPRSQKKVLSDLHTKEVNANSNGIADTLKLHGEIARETNRVNFADNPLSFNKGFLPNDLNASVGFEIIREDEVDNYERRGFTVASELQNAQMDKSTKKVLVINPATGKQRYVSGGVSLQQTVKSGNTVFENRNPNDAPYITEAQQEFMKLVAKTNYTRYSPRSEESFLIPSYDRMGNLLSLSYEMTSYGLDKYLERDNDFTKLVGNYKGSTRANQQYPEVNRQLVDYLNEAYLSDENPKHFVEISRDAPTAKGRELWAMLPVELRDYITSNGNDSLHIKPELVDMMFGYQKLNPGLAFKKEQELRNVAETIYTSLYEHMFGDLAEMKFNKHYANWISAIALMKEIIVVRTGVVLMGNIMSNLSLLMLNKFDPKNGVKDIKTALKYSYEYQKDMARLNELEAERTANPSGKLNAEYSVVKDSIARNPLKEFIEAGMMPGIVMDVEFIKSEFRHNSDFDKLLIDIEGKLPKSLLKVGKIATVAKGTKMHNFMMNATQQSDFVFKYAVYQQELRKGKTKEAAIRRARDFFVDYDIPTSQGMQFMNDIGIFMFSKFALRIQRVVVTLARENPGGMLIESLLMTQLFGVPSVAGLSIPARVISMQNPLRIPFDDLVGMYSNPFPIAIFKDLFIK